MALSNILNEPRREFTESVVGVALLGAFLISDYYFAVWFCQATNELGMCPSRTVAIIVSMIVGVILSALIIMAVFVVHAIGEEFCDSLERNGIRLRPKRIRS